jgi:hypothetical protein
MIIKYANIFHSKALQNLPNVGIFGLKIFHLATLIVEDKVRALWARLGC